MLIEYRVTPCSKDTDPHVQIKSNYNSRDFSSSLVIEMHGWPISLIGIASKQPFMHFFSVLSLYKEYHTL